LVFDAKLFQGAVPIHSTPDSNNACPYPNLLDPLEWTGSADKTGNESSSFHVNSALAEEGNENENENKFEEGREEEKEDQLGEEQEDGDDEEDDEESDEYTSDNTGSSDQSQDYGVIPPPFPEQYQTHSLRITRGKCPSRYIDLFVGVARIQAQFDQLQVAMAAIQQTLAHPVLMYLPEPQMFQAVLQLPQDLRKAWLHATCMELKNLIDKGTFSLNDWP
jgi:hypothetical protein